MPESLPARPWCCPEPRCLPIHQLRDYESEPLDVPQPGESFICFGACKSIEFSYDGIEHKNDLRSCHHSTLKGVVAYQENETDWLFIGEAYAQALRALKESPDA